MLSRRCFCVRRLHTVLGIETSCDDTAVSLVRSDRRVLFSRRVADRDQQARLGGICPSTAAIQHRTLLPSLIDECLSSTRHRIADIDAVAVSTRPGLVIALKEGVHSALELARLGRVPLIPVHHMRAHALVASLVYPSLQYPFVALLISGGHSLIVLVRSFDNFEIIGTSDGGSAGECLDKVGRELGLDATGLHAGAALEHFAARSEGGGAGYDLPGVKSSGGANFNFAALKSGLLGKLRQSNGVVCVEDFCAVSQRMVTRHLCSRLHAAFEFLQCEGSIHRGTAVVIAGGVAANRYINSAVSKLCDHHGLSLLRVPPSLCTDNAEMVAWTGILALENSSDEIIPWDRLPSFVYVHARSPIGLDRTKEVPKHPRFSLKISSIDPETGPIVVHDKEVYRNQAKLADQ